MDDLRRLLDQVRSTEPVRRLGRVREAVGLVLESEGPPARLGELCLVLGGPGEEPLKAEVVGFRGSRLLLMAIGDTHRVGAGSKVVATGRRLEVAVSEALLGQVVNGLGEPLQLKGLGSAQPAPPAPLAPEIHSAVSSTPTRATEQAQGSASVEDAVASDHPVEPSDTRASPPVRRMPLDNQPPNPLSRPLITEPLAFGIRAIDACLTCGRGQRLGVFSAAGVGKSTLLGMVARRAQCDVSVIALVGERGREVREFIENNLGPEGLARSVVVVATSDQPPLVRIKCAQVATAIAEYFRDLGRDVLLIMDSVTRVAWAMREVSLAVGEPPTRSGYTPSVFASLPRLMERAGMGPPLGPEGKAGSITALYAVLVEGDDMDDPVADTVRGILDGHIVLSRRLAAQGHYPAIDLLQSISRLMPQVVPPDQRRLAEEVRELLAAYHEAEDLVNLGAYEAGSNPVLDRALALKPSLDAFLRQDINEFTPLEESWRRLGQVLASVPDSRAVQQRGLPVARIAEPSAPDLTPESPEDLFSTAHKAWGLTGSQERLGGASDLTA